MKQMQITLEDIKEAIFIRDAITEYCERHTIDKWELDIEGNWYVIVNKMKNESYCDK